MFMPPQTTDSGFFLPQHNRKRRAPSPPPQPTYSHPSQPSGAKRRRPNLANGFSSLSLATSPHPELDTAGPSSLPTYDESQQLDESQRRIDDDDSDGNLFDRNDVDIQELSPRMRPGSTRSSSSSTSDVDLNFRRLPRRRPPQQANEVEHPSEIHFDTDIEVEDMTPRLGVKRRSNSADEGRSQKRARESMDVDMDIEEIPRRRKSEWYEPEKDRIVYTALSASSRSPSPDSASPPAQLSQPGSHGFTISPSMLTRLLAARNDSSIPLPFPQERETGLVLYRPLGIPPSGDTDMKDIVREWQERVQNDAGRFEVVDEDEDLILEEASGEGSGMDIDI